MAASEPALFHYLKQRFEPDSSTRVILDRRRRPAAGAAVDHPTIERRRAHMAEILSSQRVAVIRLTDEPVVSRGTSNDPAGQGGRESMEGMEGLDDRQRVDRWLEESQYLIGRMIPAYLDDRDRVRGRLETAEHDNDRLRVELTTEEPTADPEARRIVITAVGPSWLERADEPAIATDPWRPGT